MSAAPGHLYLRSGGAALLLDCAGPGIPHVLHWGGDLGELTADDVAQLRVASAVPRASGNVDVTLPVAILAEQSTGWFGTPGLVGHREGRGFSSAFRLRALQHSATQDPTMSQNPAPSADLAPSADPTVAERVEIAADDPDLELDLVIELELLVSGLVRMRGTVTNTGASVFELHSLDLNLPVPAEATELMDLTGRHLRERIPQRLPFAHGTHLRENRRARQHGAALLLAAGPTGFGWRFGQVRAVHVAWSGNTRTYAERSHTGDSFLAGGELLLAGEVRLAENAGYRGPWIYFSTGDGLDGVAARFHRYLRSRPQHPSSSRPVHLNVWEAVHFEHDLGKLIELADIAASVGVERYVLDDGWFSSRRDSTSGLGDWFVSPEVWPHGLAPLADHVHRLGMQFGLWFEPEMVNPDSEVARAHPEWMLAPGDRLPLPARNQQVLNLAIPEAYRHVRDQMFAVLRSTRIDYIKWDHNRDLLEAGDRRTGQAGVHEQTLAAYRLMDEVRAAFPGLEIESCSGGGGRTDLGIIERCDRVWASDCIDPLERVSIEEGMSLLLPPELVGSHIASPLSQTTGRSHSLDFRAGTAFFSHLGIEWDLSAASEAELHRLRLWLEAHKAHRRLLHSGSVVHADQPGDAFRVHGVVSEDREEAIFTVVSVATSAIAPPGRVRVPGLDPAMRYRVAPLAPGDAVGGRTSHGSTRWWPVGTVLPGTVLSHVGVQVPNLNPEQMVLLHLTLAP